MTTLDLGQWFALCTSARNTLKLVDTLNAAGVKAWAPVDRRMVRLPRRKVRREVVRPLLSGYVFADVSELETVMAMRVNPAGVPFRLFLNDTRTGVHLFTDQALAPLRGAESHLHAIFERFRRKTGPSVHHAIGTRVRTDGGPFAGLPGVVEGTKGKSTMVRFPGFPNPIEVASLLLLPESGMSAETLPERRAA
jgi:transcription antitermination factor NusG